MRDHRLALACLACLFRIQILRRRRDCGQSRDPLRLAQITVVRIIEPDALRILVAVADIHPLSLEECHIGVIILRLAERDAVAPDAERIRRAHKVQTHDLRVRRPHRQTRPHVCLIRALARASLAL